MIAFDIRNYGYYDNPHQTEPKYDPGETAPCLICDKPWTDETVRTISVRTDDDRSWFYRVHRQCHDQLTEEGKGDLDGLLLERLHDAPRDQLNRIIDSAIRDRDGE